MRVDKVLVGAWVGDHLFLADSPNDYISLAMRKYVAGTAGTFSLVKVFENKLRITDMLTRVFGEYRGLISSRDIFSARSKIMDMLEPESFSPLEAETMYAVMLGAMCASGGAKWESPTGMAIRRGPELPRPSELASLVAESAASMTKIGTVTLAPRERLQQGDVFDSVRAIIDGLAQLLKEAGAERGYAKRVFRVAEQCVGVKDEVADLRPYLTLLEYANFHLESKIAATKVPPILEMGLIGSHADRIKGLLLAHKHLTSLSASEYLARFESRRIFESRTERPVATIYTRSYVEASQPTTIASATAQDDGSTIVTPSADRGETSLLDGLLSETATFARRAADALIVTLSEANAVRYVYTTLTEQEEAAIALMSGTSVDYTARPTEDHYSRMITFERDLRVALWEDIVVGGGNDRLVSSPLIPNVLALLPLMPSRFQHPATLTAYSQVGTRKLLVDGAFSQDGTVSGGQRVQLKVQYPVYNIGPGGLRSATVSAMTATAFTFYDLLGMEPSIEYRIAPPPALQAAAVEAFRVAVLSRAVLITDPVKMRDVCDTLGLHEYALSSGAMWHDIKHRMRAQEAGESELHEAMLSLLASETMHKLHAQAVSQFRVPSPTPRTMLEANAWLVTARGLFDRVLSTVVGLDNGKSVLFRTLGREINASETFRRMARGRVIKPIETSRESAPTRLFS
jgi:hypothetical protein